VRECRAKPVPVKQESNGKVNCPSDPKDRTDETTNRRPATWTGWRHRVNTGRRSTTCTGPSRERQTIRCA